MQNYWKSLLCVAITLLILAGCKKKDTSYDRQSGTAGTPPAPVQTPQTFDPKVAQVVGRVYYLAIPLSEPSELANYVQQNRAYFVENSPVIRCASALGNKLVYQAVSSYSQGDYDKAYESSLEMGATGEIAHSVADSIQSGNLGLFAMGQELLWLAEVLPSAAEGNWTPFNTTGTEARITTRNYLSIVNSMGMMDPETLQIMQASMTQFQTLAEDQIVFLAVMTGVCK